MAIMVDLCLSFLPKNMIKNYLGRSLNFLAWRNSRSAAALVLPFTVFGLSFNFRLFPWVPLVSCTVGSEVRRRRTSLRIPFHLCSNEMDEEVTLRPWLREAVVMSKRWAGERRRRRVLTLVSFYERMEW